MHRGLDRVIFLGPQAQEIIRLFLTTNLEAYSSARRTSRTCTAGGLQQRKTKRTPSELKRRRKAKPAAEAGSSANRRSYRLAVVRACMKAGVPAWSPLQLRHTAATRIRAQFGLEAAKAILDIPASKHPRYTRSGIWDRLRRS